jgi:hypothetical protein
VCVCVCVCVCVSIEKRFAKILITLFQAFGPNAFSKFYVAPFQIRDEFSSHLKMLGDLGMQ